MTLIEDGKPIYLVKGAPEKLLSACTTMYDEWGSKKPFTTKNRIRELLEATQNREFV